MHQAANGSTERKILINTKSQRQSHPTRRTQLKMAELFKQTRQAAECEIVAEIC